jgi:hypothetical protein
MKTCRMVVSVVLGVLAPAWTAAQELCLPTGHVVTAQQLETRRRFEVPLPLPAVRRFYARHYANIPQVNVAAIPQGASGPVHITTANPAATWAAVELSSAVGRPGVTVVRVTPRFHLERLTVDGAPPPWVTVVLPRSTHAQAPTQQDHLTRRR